MAAMIIFGLTPHLRAGLPADDDKSVPDGLGASAWFSIRAAYETSRHAVIEADGGYQACNPGQQWRTHYDSRGFLTVSGNRSWSWGLRLIRYGYEGDERAVKAPTCVEVDGGRFSYVWDDSLTEWYINDVRGLEHGYTVHQRPSSLDSSARVGLLQFTLVVRGNLRPRVSTFGRDVTFVNDTGAAVISYRGLAVLDASGAVLPAWFEVATESADRTPHTMPLSETGESEALRIIVDDTNAIYPLTVDPIAQQAYLKAAYADAFHRFGHSVAISGDTVVVGAPSEGSSATGVNGNPVDTSAADSGAAYVFVRDASGIWSQQAYLKASNTDSGDFFGSAVSVWGDTVIVGAEREASSASGVNGDEADNSATGAGAAYVFVRDANGNWSQQAYLKASNTDSFDQFGDSVSVSGDTVIVGAPFEDSSAAGVDGDQSDNSAFDSGAAYAFIRDGNGTWSQQAYLKASTNGPYDLFGGSLAVSGDTLVVGAREEASSATGVNGDQADNGSFRSGAAYVFVRDVGDAWSQQAYLKASNTGEFDFFGRSVAISGDTVVVGAQDENSSATGVNGDETDDSAGNSGAAYVFARDAEGFWIQQAYLKASNTEANDAFGYSVAVFTDTVVVGAPGEDGGDTGVNGNQTDNNAANSGAAYVFVRNGAMWSQQVYLKASNTGESDFFGISVAAGADTLVIGAQGEESNATGIDGNQADNSAPLAGATYLFETPTPCSHIGDMNCDCAVDIADVPAFVQALLDPAGYAAMYPGCDIVNADAQPDGLANGDDMQGFIDLLIP